MSEFDSDKTPNPSKEGPLEDALNRWANDAEGYQPLDTVSLAQASARPHRVFNAWRTAATLAAAAMVVFALAQVSFTISMGGTTLQWGATAADDVGNLSAQLAEATSRIAVFEDQLSTHVEAINTVAAQNALLSESLHVTAIELAQRQDLESAVRVYDMQNLAQFVSYQQ